MAVTFSRTSSFALSDTVDAADLHSLIENATLTGLTGSDITGGGLYGVQSQYAAPSPTDSPFWFKDDPWDPVFKVWAQPWNCWVALGPDRIEVPFKNSAATDLACGTLVIGAGASLFSIATNPSLNALGFIQDTCASGSCVGVCTNGIGWVLWGSSTSTSGLPYTRWAITSRTNSKAGSCDHLNIDGVEGHGVMFGMYLESQHSGLTAPGIARLARIWGPKTPTGF